VTEDGLERPHYAWPVTKNRIILEAKRLLVQLPSQQRKLPIISVIWHLNKVIQKPTRFCLQVLFMDIIWDYVFRYPDCDLVNSNIFVVLFCHRFHQLP
jgi:hypothetical protein